VPVRATTAYDLKRPRAGPRYSGLHLAPLVPGVADDAFNEREGAPGLLQQRLGSIAVLHAGRVNGDGQQQAQRVGQDVALTANDLLARVIAGRVERSPPLRAPLALWLSMIAVVGLASRPACSRVSTYRA